MKLQPINEGQQVWAYSQSGPVRFNTPAKAPIRNATAKGKYTGAMTAPVLRPGADDHKKHKSFGFGC